MKKLDLLHKVCGSALAVLLVLSCTETPDMNLVNNADFSFEIDDEDPFTVHFNNESESYHSSYWRFGDGSNHSTEASPSHTFEAGGTYDVTLMVQGDNSGGETQKTVQIIDPALLGERITDGTFQDETAWTVQEAGYDLLTDVEFTAEGLHLSNAGGGVDTNVTVWQEIQVEAGKEYVFTSHVQGGGFDQAWLEIHLSNEKPDGNDYGVNSMWSLNTWAECGIEPFEGDLVNISCAGNGGNENTYTFEEGGTAYIVIKAGSWQGAIEGVTISEVSLMPIDEVD